MRTYHWNIMSIENYFHIGLWYTALDKIGFGIDAGMASRTFMFSINILCFDLEFVIVRHAWREEHLFKAGSSVTA